MFNFRMAPKLIYEAFPYFVHLRDGKYFVAVKGKYEIEEFLPIPDEHVGRDFADLLQARRWNRAFIENPEV